MLKKGKKEFYGSTTIGEKGQVVVPAEARKKLELEKGEKLLVFGFDDDTLIFAKLSKIEKIASHLSEHLKDISKIIEKEAK